ncbi:unnamed protein product [Pieris macdunnoughi]|uniref:Uncharacterized protein n=1 Tax=Pieris macdunnoughi TaxID=345717 RepID=A0A821UH89_9NEOP|nr:unnamed protein product [Pieris macdunnoughi]
MASTSSGKERTYKEAILQWGFTSIVDKNIEKPQCVLCLLRTGDHGRRDLAAAASEFWTLYGNRYSPYALSGQRPAATVGRGVQFDATRPATNRGRREHHFCIKIHQCYRIGRGDQTCS